MRSLTNIRFYERLAMTKHHLRRVYHHLDDVAQLYLKRWREKDWDEKEERDTMEFLEVEKEIYRDLFPHTADIFNDDDEDPEDEMLAGKENAYGGKRARESGGKKEEVVELDCDEDEKVEEES